MDARDPNFNQDSQRESSGFRFLTRETIVQLDQFRRTLQLIVFSLILGVIGFGGFVIANSDGPRAFFGPDRMDIMLGMAAICAVASIIVPLLVGRSSRTGVSQVNPQLQSLLTGDQDHDQAIHAAGRIQITTIIGCALLEGGAFPNLFALMQTNDDVHTLVVVVLLIGIALRFPTRSRYLQRIEYAVEKDRLEQSFTK